MNVFEALQLVVEGATTSAPVPNGTDIAASIDFDVRDPYVYIRFANGQVIAIEPSGAARFI